MYNKSLLLKTAQEEYLWMVVPKAVAYKHVKDPQMIARMKKLVKQKRWSIRCLRGISG